MFSARHIIQIVITGISAGLLTIFVVPSDLEILVWLIVIAWLGWITIKYYRNRIFWIGFLGATITGVSITVTHLTFFSDYLYNHQEEADALKRLAIADSERIAHLIIAPIYWFALGLATGLSALLWQKFKK